MSEPSLSDVMAKLTAIEAMLAERAGMPAAGEDLTVDQFAAAIGRKPLFVYRRIKSRQIAVRKGGRPYRIPADQVDKFRKPTACI